MLSRRLFTAAALALPAIALALTTPEAEARSPIYTGLVSGTGAGGYDVVAYHKQRRAVRGSTKYIARWNGAKWRFSSPANLAAFKASPSRYAPAYGGHCSWAVSQGYTAKGDPRHWKIVGGRLYLNFNGSIHRRWLKNASGHIRKANANWPGVLK